MTDDTLVAMGRVVYASARFEQDLRWWLDRLSGSDALWWIFEGESFDKLLKLLPKVVEEVRTHDVTWQDTDQKHLVELIGRSRTLYNFRNAVVHGSWSRTSLYEGETGLDRLKQRFVVDWSAENRALSRTAAVPQEIWYLVRSRPQTKELLEYSLTVRELDLLFEELQIAAAKLHVALRV